MLTRFVISTGARSSHSRGGIQIRVGSSPNGTMSLTTNWTEAVQRSDVDAVVVCTHNESHAEIAMAAIRSGKHVLTEYPIARSIEQGDRLREALRESGKGAASNARTGLFGRRNPPCMIESQPWVT